MTISHDRYREVMNKSFKALLNNRIIKSIVTMASGTVIGYAINTFALPVIGRVYTRADIGNYDLIISSASLFMTLFMLSLTLVIIVPETDYEANGICKLILVSNVIGVICMFSVLLAVRRWFLLFETVISYPLALLLVSLYILSGNIQIIYYSYLNRKGLFGLMFWNPIILAAVNSGISIFLGIIGMGTVGYLLGTMAGNFVSIVYMSGHVKPFEFRHEPATLLEYLKKYKQFPLVQMPANFVEYLALQLPIQFFGREYSTEMLGGYTMACKLLSMPVTLLGTPINRVYYKELVDRIADKKDTDGFVIKVLKANYMLIAIPVGVLMIWGPQITGLFLGEEWIESGYYISVIGFAYIIKFCTQCIGGTFIATDNTGISLKYAICTLVQYGSCFGAAHYFGWGFKTVMVLHTVNTIINGLICIELVNRCVGGRRFKTTGIVMLYVVVNLIVVYGIMYTIKMVL